MTLLLLVALGGLLALDGVSVGQFMVSRPLVAGVLAGAIAGDVVAGAQVGVLLELYLIVAVPTGGARFPEPGPASVVGAATAVATGGPAGLVLGVALALVWGQVGGLSQTALRRLNARAAPVPGEDRVSVEAVRRAHLGSIARDGARGLVLTAAGLTLGLLLTVPARTWPLAGPESRSLVLLGAMVSMGILVRGDDPGLGRLALFAAGVLAGGLLV